MSDEFESLNSRLPDLGAVLAQRVAQKQQSPMPGTFDPYQAMIKKKESETIPIDPSTIQQQWPEVDVKRLQDYCQKMGIVGFSAGKMNPIAALALLKQQYGEDYTGIPLEERVPPGYSSNYPYSQAIQKKQILHG